MTSRICVDLKIVGRLRTYGRLEQLRACGHDFGVSFLEVVDPQIEVDLLRSSLRPLGRYVVGRELNPTFGSPFTSTMCQSSSASTVPPSSRAQKVLSAFKSAASKTTTWRLIFTAQFSSLVRGGRPRRRLSRDVLNFLRALRGWR